MYCSFSLSIIDAWAYFMCDAKCAHKPMILWIVIISYFVSALLKISVRNVFQFLIEITSDELSVFLKENLPFASRQIGYLASELLNYEITI